MTNEAPAAPIGSGALIVVPTYNEAVNLLRLLDAINEVAPGAHVLVVDDGSPDGTGDLADTRAAADSRVHALHREGKQGLGTAYIAGFRWALDRDYERVLEMDADFSHQPKYLPALLATSERFDMAVGSRYVPGGGTEGWPLRRRLLSRGGNLYSRLVLGLPYKDMTGGFRCFRASALRAIDLGGIEAVGYGFQVELLYRIHSAGLSIGETPIVFPDRTDGESKMSGAIVQEALLGVWRLRLGRP